MGPGPPRKVQGKLLEIDAPSEAERDWIFASLADPAVACITVIEPFEANLPLGSFSGGRYSVYVTTDPALPAELLGEFDS